MRAFSIGAHMKETGLMFKAELVRAILNGQKTQTRRVVKWRDQQAGLNLGFSGLKVFSNTPNTFTLESQSRNGWESRSSPTRCPMGQPGDRIYVRETFGHGGDAYTPDIYYRASQPDAPIQGCWHPAIHMRKADARLWLEVTGVRIERLHQITDAECWAEGGISEARPDKFSVHSVIATDGKAYLSPRGAFSALWESTGGDWDANPWVWVIDFKRIEKP